MLSVIWPTSWLQSVSWHGRVALIGIASSHSLLCSHISWLKSWCVGLADWWFLVCLVWCHCTSHQCGSSGMSKLLRHQWGHWTHFPGCFFSLSFLDMSRCCHHLKPLVPRKPTMLAYHLSQGMLEASNVSVIWPCPFLECCLLVVWRPVKHGVVGIWAVLMPLC